MSAKRGPFTFIFEGDVVKVYLGNPTDAESEFVLAIDKAWLPSLIATLKEASFRDK